MIDPKDKKDLPTVNLDCMDIFQAILMNRNDILNEQINTGTNNKYILHLKHQTPNGRTPLYFAAQHGKLEVVKKILQTGVISVDKGDEDGWTPLFIAAVQGHKDIVEFLIENMSSVDVVENKYGWTPLCASSWYNRDEVIKVLLKHGADINFKDKRKRSALWLAVTRGHVKIIELLLENKADVNSGDEFGRTPLYMAVESNLLAKKKKSIIKLLIEHKCDMSLKDMNGVSPIVVAYKQGYSNIEKLLLDSGADKTLLEEVKEMDRNKLEETSKKDLFSATTMLLEIRPTPAVNVMSLTHFRGNIWAGGNDGSIIIFNTTNREIKVYKEKAQHGTVHQLLVCNNRIWALSGNVNAEIVIWDFDEDLRNNRGVKDPYMDVGLKHETIITAGGEEINCIIKVEDEIWGGSSKGVINKWDAYSYQRKDSLYIDYEQLGVSMANSFITSMTYNGANGRLFVAVRKVIFLYSYNLKKKILNFQKKYEGHANNIDHMYEVNDHLWSSSLDSTIRVWDIKTGECLKTIKNGTYAYYVGGNQVLGGVCEDFSKIISFDDRQIAKKKELVTTHNRLITCMYWVDEINELWVGNLNKTISLWQ